jgi:hypothetical protein
LNGQTRVMSNDIQKRQPQGAVLSLPKGTQKRGLGWHRV